MASSNATDLAKTPKRRSGASRKVRNVARIGGFSDPAAEISWISVNKTGGEASESVTLSFRDQSASRKECFELDCFYDQNQDNEMIFSREVKSLIAGVLGGCNATVVALGARGSGKTSLVQGSSEKPGLAAMAMDEIISVAEKNGSSVTISSYEVYQDHIYDVLDPSRPEVLVLGNTRGSIRLKGLSQVPVKSMSEFGKLYVNGCASRKPAAKGVAELSRRSHKGLIVYVSSHREDADTPQVAKLNFVDLAGYEDMRRKSIGGGVNHVDNSKINKSIYAMLNVIQAVSSTGTHVPYRESKLTYLLQDSLGGTSKVLTITCLKPSFCQDSIYMVGLVSRSSQNINEAVTGSKMKSKGLTRPAVPSSQKAHMPMPASKKRTINRVPLSNKKVTGPLSSKKADGSMTSAIKGRKLFDERHHLTKSVKASAMSDVVSTIGTSVTENSDKEESVSIVNEGTDQLKSESTLSNELNPVEPTSIVEKDELLSDESKQAELSLIEEMDYLHLEDPKQREDDAIAEKDHPVNEDGYCEEVDPCVDSGSQCALALVKDDHDIEKENNHLQANEVASPPISARLEELANNLKSLCSTTPSCIKLPEETDDPSYNCTDITEPKTPFANQDIQQNDRWEVANINSPWEMLSVRSTGVKKSLVQEYLSFLNTASKEDLKRLKGIGEKRATYILECREETPEPFKSLDDLQEIGLSAKQVKNLMKKAGGGLFD